MNTNQNPHIAPAVDLVNSHRKQAVTGTYVLADDAKFFADSHWITDKSVITRSLLERAVIRCAVKALLAQVADNGSGLGPAYTISVYDGESTVISKSRDEAQIMGSIMATDKDVLRVYRGDAKVGYIHLVYGNDGWDVMADFSMSLSEVLESACDFADACGEVP